MKKYYAVLMINEDGITEDVSVSANLKAAEKERDFHQKRLPRFSFQIEEFEGGEEDSLLYLRNLDRLYTRKKVQSFFIVRFIDENGITQDASAAPSLKAAEKERDFHQSRLPRFSFPIDDFSGSLEDGLHWAMHEHFPTDEKSYGFYWRNFTRLMGEPAR